jgi:hypothetical protein
LSFPFTLASRELAFYDLGGIGVSWLLLLPVTVTTLLSHAAHSDHRARVFYLAVSEGYPSFAMRPFSLWPGA